MAGLLPAAALAVLAVVVTACGTSGPVTSGPAPASGSTPTPTPTRSATAQPSTDPGTPWRPTPGEDWQWQLSGSVDLSVAAPVYDIDGQENSATTVARLHQLGRHAICYVSVGSWEKSRPDAGAFPRAVIGKTLDGWPDESWFDIRQIDQLSGPLGRRFDDCRAKGFDAVEPDNVDGYQNSTGFPLTAADQLRFNRWVAGAVHARGMGVALKNDTDQVGALVGTFDFAVVEECLEYDECAADQPFLTAGKAVLHTEYTDSWPDGRACSYPGFSSIRKRRALDAWRGAC